MASDNSVKVAIIGIGGWAEKMAEAIEKSKKIELVSCFTRTREKRKEFSQKYHCNQAGSYEEILNDPKIDAVILETPNFIHCQQTVEAAKHGKHVFVDKPIANTVAEAKKMREVCQQARVILAVGHNTRRMAGHRKMKSLIDEGVLGNIIMAEANFSHAGGLGLTPEQWRWYEDKCPSGPLLQLGVHQVDTLSYLLGPAKKVSAMFNKLATPAEIADVTVTVIKFGSGVLGYIGSNYVTPYIFYINVYATKANLFCENGSKLYIQKKDSLAKEEIEVKEVDSILEELEEFADCIRLEKKPEVGGEEAINALAIVQAAIKSVEISRPVTIDEVLER